MKIVDLIALMDWLFGTNLLIFWIISEFYHQVFTYNIIGRVKKKLSEFILFCLVEDQKIIDAYFFCFEKNKKLIQHQ